MYGGYLNALAMRAALLAAGKQYPHPLTVNMDFISGVKKGEEIGGFGLDGRTCDASSLFRCGLLRKMLRVAPEIFVETTKSTRRLLFLRISVGSPSGLALTASGLFGTLSTGDSSKDGPTQLDERYDLARQLPNSPSLSFSDSSLPSNIIADAIDLLPGADKMMLMDKGPLNYMDFFGIRYPREAAAEVAKAVNEGRLRKETWDKAHRMPYIVGG